MFRFPKLVILLILILGNSSQLVLAQGQQPGHPDAITTATPKLQAGEIVATGKVICLGCSLKKDKGANAQCSIYGHTNAIVLEKVIDHQGKKLNELKGKIYQFLHNDQSDSLIKDHSYVGKTVIVVGKIYPEANTIEVNFFKVKEEEVK